MKKSTLGLAVIAAIPMFSSMQVVAAEDGANAIEKIQKKILHSKLMNARTYL